MAKLEQEIAALFGLSLEEFTPARDRLAQRLKKEGRGDAADEVRRLAKPSVPAWAINQLARREQPAVKALLDAGSALRKAQERALSGIGPADGLREAQSTERKVVRGLTEHARTILEDAGRPAAASMLDRIARTLAAAAVAEPGREALKAGRLTGEVEPAGFEALAGLTPPVSRPASSSRDEVAERRRANEERKQRKRDLGRKANDLERRARAAEQDADRAERAAVEAHRAAEEIRRAAARAAEELAELE